ncbi:MAG: CBS domain-containing protein [Algoriphagus sp.]|uniref:DUF294 nucleotidyltransferase-like domain-containing protein n=1 Tax=Algoriphagus sp. TaxID=1872435 RepID=UPI001827171F|nr:DUF294 nucleotidyltransferase-like domain-containing protein [Algoriphagus sp.]NVJ84836.1 CBS domain-containing protein [Algoriphagus sp.]
MKNTAAFISDQFYSKYVRDLHFRHLRMAQSSDTVQECASQMAKEQVSCLFIGDSPEAIEGYITDITLRDKVLAKGLSLEILVQDIMESSMVSIHPDATLVEALMLMFRTKSRYLLVKEAEQFIGWISRTKILTEQSQGPFMFIQSVKEARQIPELKEKWKRMPEIIHLLLSRGMKASIVNQIISTVADTITQRVIERVKKDVGPAPAKFVFFVLGSEGRGELTLKTDQDNAIIYEDKANEKREKVRAYFLDFATRVSTALDQIGIDFCEGELMAMNPKWTHSLSHWKRNYETWISDASQETAMKYATFFDCRAIYGDADLLAELKLHMNQLLDKAPERFFINLGYNALQYEPPLTFFRQIRTEKIDGEKQFNLKHAMRTMVDLARVYALKYQIEETNTLERLFKLKDRGVFSEAESQELIHAFSYLMAMRLENQAELLLAGSSKPLNWIRMEKLTKVQNVTLIEIFKVIRDFQARIRISFTKSL